MKEAVEIFFQLNSLYQFLPYIVPLYSDKGEWLSLVPLSSGLSYLIERVHTFSGKARLSLA